MYDALVQSIKLLKREFEIIVNDGRPYLKNAYDCIVILVSIILVSAETLGKKLGTIAGLEYATALMDETSQSTCTSFHK